MDEEHLQEHFEDNTQVFIVRLWFERRLNHALPVEWRGVIEHLSSGERRSFKELAVLNTFIERYLPPLPTPTDCRQRLIQWICQRFQK